MSEKEIILIHDGSNFLHRNYHAYPNLTSKKGVPTGAIYGAVKMLSKLQEEFKPAKMIICTDFSRKSFRTDLYPDYKGNRSSTPQELRDQFALLEKFCEVSGVCCLKKENYEADDLMASFARVAVEQGYLPYIVSGDRDLFQCVTEDVNMIYASTKEGFVPFNLDKVKEKYEGLSQEQIVELKAITGDASDNYKGVQGVGEKTAISLLKTYGNIDNIYEHISELKGKQKERFEQYKEDVYLCKKLAKIDNSVDVIIPENSLIDFAKLETKQFLNELDIYSL